MVAQGGTSISSSSVMVRLLVRLVSCFGGGSGWNADRGVVGGVGTLLGPEGAGELLLRTSAPAALTLGVGVVVVRLGLALRPYRVWGFGSGCWWSLCGLVLPVA